MKILKSSFILFPILLFVFSVPVQALERQSAVVREVLSGDTVRLEGGKTLKYAGLAAPPLQSIVPLVRKYGVDAKEFNEAAVRGKSIAIEWGPQIRDDLNNLLGYVYLEDGTSLNELLLRNGHAKLRLQAPNLKYGGAFRKAELEARRAKRGLWKEEPDNPFIQSEYIGEKNTKIYYFPTSPELERIPEAQLVRFRSRVEAKAAGYKSCFTCNEDDRDVFLR